MLEIYMVCLIWKHRIKIFFSFKLSPHLLDSIQKNYIDFLRENIIPDIADMYQKELDQYTKNSKM